MNNTTKYLYKVCPEGIQPRNMKSRHNKHCTWDNDASVPFKVVTLGPHTVFNSPSAAPSYFPESHWWSEICSLSKVILVLGKARRFRAPNLGSSGAESPGCFDVLEKNSAQDIMHEQMYCCDEAANHQLPIAVAFWIIQIVIVEECSSLTQNFMQISLLYSLNHFECNGHTVHMLTQWCLPAPTPTSTSTVKLSLFTRVHSISLFLADRLHRCCTNHSCYINNGCTFSGQTIYIYTHTDIHIYTHVVVVSVTRKYLYPTEM